MLRGDPSDDTRIFPERMTLQRATHPAPLKPQQSPPACHVQQQWTHDLTEPISQSDAVLFLDASATLAPGKVQLKNVEPAREFSSNLTHTMSPEALLALAVQLYSRKPERAFLLTIGGASFDHADVLSEPVRAAIPVALNLIKAALSGVSLPETFFRSQNTPT